IMTPQSVGVPDSRLVLGKHSGRHALALRCEQLGFQFNRRELDDVYRRFVVLADRIKKVQDSHLLELIQEMSGKKIPPASAVVPFSRVASAAAHESPNLPFPAIAHGSGGPGPHPVAFADHQ